MESVQERAGVRRVATFNAPNTGGGIPASLLAESLARRRIGSRREKEAQNRRERERSAKQEREKEKENEWCFGGFSLCLPLLSLSLFVFSPLLILFHCISLTLIRLLSLSCNFFHSSISFLSLSLDSHHRQCCIQQ